MSCPNSCDKFCIPCVQKLSESELHRRTCSAIHANDTDLARFYLTNGVNVRMKDSVILVNAIEKNFPRDFIAECIRLGADVNARDGRALRTACQYSDRAQAIKGADGYRLVFGRMGMKKTNEWIQYRNDLLSLLLDSGAIVDDVCFDRVLNMQRRGNFNGYVPGPDSVIPNQTAVRLFASHGFVPRAVHLFDKFLQCDDGSDTFSARRY